MEVIITDVTNMSPGQHCVAGFDVARNCMVRLLPNGRNWTTQLINQVGVYKGVVLDVEPQHEAHNSSYPHASEDTRIWANNINQYDGCV
jgi:hypothetical protein